MLSDQTAPAVVEICRGLDGIPLALELAAARVRMMSIEQLAERLDEDVHILRGTSRTGSPRHETIRATIDWSHDLLDQCEQMLLRRLAVFAGGWTLEMAEDVCPGQGLERSEILDLLSQLVDKSMVLVSASDGARYRLLGPIRQYALERLRLSGEESEIMSRLATTTLNAA